MPIFPWEKVDNINKSRCEVNIKIGESKMETEKQMLLKQIAEIEQRLKDDERTSQEQEQRRKDNQKTLVEMKKQLEELNKKEVEVSATGVYLNKISDNDYAYLGFDNEIFETRKFNQELETDLIRINNIFATRKQAEQEALRREGQEFIRRCAMLWNKGNDWRKKPNTEQHYIFLNNDNTMIECAGYATTRGDIQFDTKELAERCIAELKSKYNEEQIKTIFGVI